ncbi:MAG: hypothetical protein EXS32_17180 [Opitutus sp.]|nr:hypothetical protein [Opitutus sp.]
MAPSEKPLVYLVLGAAGSGRREVIADLLEAGLNPDDRAAVLVSEGEAASESDARLPGLGRWGWTDGVIAGQLPREATLVFFVTDGRTSPVDQIEVFKAWLEAQGGELARVLCVVHCSLVEKNPPLLAWYEACIHFSDVALLSRREGVANKWLSDFLAHFKSRFSPCLFELVKAGRVKNPALVLEPQARRMSHVFEAEPDWIFTKADGEVIEEDEVTDDDEEEVEVTAEEDPYFVRDAAGRWAKRLPEITKFLSADL